MTVFSGFTNHLRIGLDVATDPFNTFTPNINVYLTWTVQCDSSFNFNDSQTLVMTSPQGDSWTFQNVLQANQTIQFGHTIFGQGQTYGGGPTYTMAAVLNGVFLGAGPSLSTTFTLPARPTRVPAAPSTNPIWSAVTSTTATVNFGDTTDNGGLGDTDTWLRIATDPGMSNIVWQDTVGTPQFSFSVTGLTPGTTYYAQAAIANADGWGAWSGVSSAKTLAGGHARVGGSWTNAVSYVRVGGSWVQATPHVRVGGAWVTAT